MTTLTDRYVRAVQRWVPEARREEIGRDLRGSIDELVEARAAGGDSEPEAERAVLTEMGDPVVHAGRYTDRPMQLIGPRYFPTYWRLLLQLLIWVPVPVGLVVGAIEAFTADDGEIIGSVIGAAVGTSLTVALHVAFWTTLGFAILERLGDESTLQEWTVDDLPEDLGDQHMSLVEAVGSVAVLGILAVAVATISLRDVPVIDSSLWSLWIPIMLVGFVVAITAALWRYRRQRRTVGIAVAEVLSTVLVVAPIGWLAHRGDLLAPEFVRAVEMTPSVQDGVERATVIVAVAVIVLSVADIAFRAWRGRETSRR